MNTDTAVIVTLVVQWMHEGKMFSLEFDELYLAYMKMLHLKGFGIHPTMTIK